MIYHSPMASPAGCQGLADVLGLAPISEGDLYRRWKLIALFGVAGAFGLEGALPFSLSRWGLVFSFLTSMSWLFAPWCV